MSATTRAKPRRIGGDWVEAYDEKSKRVYYANMKTKETTWTLPEEVKRFQEESIEMQREAAKKKSVNPAAGASKGSSDEKVPDGWEVRHTPQGKKYYYNKALNLTSWTPVAADTEAGRGAWVARIDPRSNRTYYYNTVTKLTSWHNPDEVQDVQDEKEKKKEEKKTRTSRRLSKSPEADEEPAFQATPTAPTNRTSARTSVRLGTIGAPKAGSRLSIADVARAKKAEKLAKSGAEEEKVQEKTEVKPVSMQDRFAKLRALRERTQGKQEDDEAHEKHIDLDDMTASAMADVMTLDLHMENYAEQYFNLKRKGLGKKGATTVEKILAWKDEKIKTSLHPLNDPALVHDAVLAFSNILHYMGDKPSKDPIKNARKIFRITVGAPEELRDEVLCQLIKQTNENPDATSTLRGWELMAMACGLFPPSAKLEKYLLSYMRRTVEHAKDAQIGKMAEYALLRAQRSLELGPRTETPTEMEIAAVRETKPVRAEVHMLDGQVITLDAESWTCIKELNDALSKRLKIKDAAPFSLFEVNSLDEERALEDDDRVLDVIAYWEREREMSKKKKDKPVFQFVYKVRLFFDIKEDDEAALELEYHQAVHDVTDSRYPCEEEDAYRLAALMAQERFGDFVEEDDQIGSELQAFLPARFFDDDVIEELKAEVNDVWKLLKGYDRNEAMLNYVQYVKGWKMYGSAFFFVEPQQRDFQPQAVLAVNSKAVLLIDPETQEITHDWPYSEIVTWGNSAITFVVVVGNLIRSNKYFFKTEQGQEINSLVTAYVNRLAASDDK